MDINWILDILTSSYMSLFFLLFIGYFCWHNVYDYNDLADVVTAIGTNEAGILIPYQLDINENLVIPSNITLRVIQGGNLNIGKYSIRNATYKWTSSPAAGNEYYLELAAGGDPGLTEPPDVLENGYGVVRRGALGTLIESEWNWGDNDTLGYDTIYVRIVGSTDPDGKAEDYLETTYRVTINGPIEAGLYQIFKGPGSVSFSGTRVGDGLLKDMDSHWRGSSPLEALDVRGGIKLRDRDPQTVVTFTIDDWQYTAGWAALFASKGINGTACLNADPMLSEDKTPWLTLQTAGWEMASHTKSHLYLGALTEERIEDEVGASKRLLESWGFIIRNFCYPYGDFNDLVRKIVRKYYLGACRTIIPNTINVPPFTMDGLLRVDGDGESEANLKTAVDDAISLEGWMIVALHDADAPKLTKIGNLIDYIQGLNVQILTMSEAEDLIGNLMNSLYFNIGAEGERRGILHKDSAVPTTGTWKQSDIIWNTEPAAGGSPGWVCTISGTFSAATDNTGDTTNGSPIITGMSNTADFYVDNYVTISGGFPAGPHKIIGKTTTTITLDVNATGTVGNVTVATSNPVFKAMANLAA